MNNTSKNLELILDTVIEQLILTGSKPSEILARILDHTLWIFQSKIPELTIEKMKLLDEGKRETDRWINESLIWHKALQNDGASWEDYEDSLDRHDSEISEFEKTHTKIDELAAFISTSAVQAQRLTVHLKNIKPSDQSRDDAIEVVMNMCKYRFDSLDSEFDESRLERIMRYLIDRGEYGSSNIEDISTMCQRPSKLSKSAYKNTQGADPNTKLDDRIPF